VCLHDKDRIEAFLRRNTLLWIYELGDLDERFWPHTTWYALIDGDDVKAAALVYTGLSEPTLLAMGDDTEYPLVEQLLQSILPYLPRSFYGHVSPGLAPALTNGYRVTSHGAHSKMALMDASRLNEVDTSAVVTLATADADELMTFYDQSYPGHWFEPSMLATGQYVGVRDGGGLVSVAGVHVYSPRYKVAALGNITTHPARRRNGYAQAATAGLCRNLLNTVDHVGLNVKADNHAAIACYRKLGFDIIGAYEECSVATA
jgi:ribosomal protein S18 acetylase RimI-like enzyme